MTIEAGGMVGGFEITTVIDATGRVISSRSRAMTMAELAPLFSQAQARGFHLERGTDIKSPREKDSEPKQETETELDSSRYRKPSDTAVSKAGTDEEGRRILEAAFNLGCDTNRIKELMAEFPPRRTMRALVFLESLIDKNQEIKDPTAMVVSCVLKWSRKKNK